MANPRIRVMYNNLASLNTSSLSFSSETTGFEASNALNSFRSSTWKMSGRFEISDGSATYDGAQNDQLYINDGGNVTVTVTAGQYATPELLATQIQTDLNAASSNWTVTYDNVGGNGSYKFTIANTGSVTIRESQTTNAIWDTLGYTSGADQTGTSFEANEQRNHTSEYLRFDIGYRSSMQFLAVIGDVSTSLGLSSQATVTLKGNNIDANWGSAPLSETITVTEKGIFAFLDTSASVTYRYWQFEIEDKYNSTAGPNIEIGQFYLGSYETPTSRNMTVGFKETQVDPSTVSESEGGVLYFDTRDKYTKLEGISIPYLEDADKQVFVDLFDEVGVTTPFYISLDPLLNINTDITDFTRYVVFMNSPDFTNVSTCRFSTVLNVREVI